MASPIANSSCAILALLLISSLFFIPSSAITKADITTLCSKARDPSFCSFFLESLSSIATATFKDLARDTINVLEEDAVATCALINRLQKEKRAPGEKVKLDLCFKYYSQVKQEMLTAQSSFVRGDRSQVQLSASKSVALAVKCQTELEGFPALYFNLSDHSLSVEDHSNILEVLLDNL